MRTPGLRLRQVFEHGTHFKVQKPGGQTITIAKKGLSPSTVGRLRRFAQGGEVKNYARDGEVTEETEPLAKMPELAPEALASAAAQPEQEISRTGRRVVAAESAQGTMDEAARQREDFERIRNLPSTAPAPTAPAQPTIIINNTPAPTAQPQAMTAEPAPKKTEEPVAPKEAPATVAQKRPASPVTIEDVPLPPSGVVPEASVSPVFVKAPQPVPTAPTAPPMGRFLSQPGLLAPLPPPMTLDLPKTEAPVEAAPAAVPVAPVAPSALVAPTPVTAPAAFKPLTAEGVAAGFKEAVKANPKATIGQVVGQMLGSDASVPALVRPEVADIPAFQLMQKPDLLKALAANIVDGINARTEEGRAELAAGQIALDQLKQQEIAAAEKAKRDVERKEEIQTHITEAKAAAEAADDIKPFFSSGGIGSTIGNIIALAVGGFMSGYTGTPNYAYDAYSKAAARDLDEQKRRRDSRWNKVKTLLGDDKAADLMIQADNDLFTSIALKKASVQQNMLKVQPQIDKLAADFMAKAIQGYGALDLRMAQAEDEREKPAPKVVVGRAGGRAGSVAEQRLEEAKKINERERLVSVEGIPVRRATKSRQAMTQDDIDRRVAYVESVAKLEKALKDYGSDVWNVLSTKRGDIIADLALSLENSPQGFGYSRALSLNAARVLKAGMGNPEGLKSAVLAQFGRDPVAGVRKLREDTQSQFKQKLAGLADPSNQRDKDASNYAAWKFDTRINSALGERGGPAPKLKTPVEYIESLPPDSPLYQPPAAVASPAAAPPPSGDIFSRLKKVK